MGTDLDMGVRSRRFRAPRVLTALMTLGVALGLLAGVTVLHAEPESGGIRLWLEPAEILLVAGEPARVVVWVEGVPASGLSAFQIELLFDPAQVEVSDPNGGSSAFQAFAPLGGHAFCTWARGGDSCPDPEWMLTSTGRSAVGTTMLDAEAGRLVIAYGTKGGEEPATGAGALAIVEVVSRTSGPVTLELLSAVLANGAVDPGQYDWTAP